MSDKDNQEKINQLNKLLAEVYGLDADNSIKANFRFPTHGVDRDFPENGVARLTITTMHRNTKEVIVKSMDVGSVCDAVSLFNIMHYANPSLVEYNVSTDPPPTADKIYVRISTMGGRILQSPTMPDDALINIDSVNGHCPLKIPARLEYKLVGVFGDSQMILAEANDLQSMQYGIKQQELRLSNRKGGAVKFIECDSFKEVVGNRYTGVVKFAIYDRRGHQVKLANLTHNDDMPFRADDTDFEMPSEGSDA